MRPVCGLFFAWLLLAAGCGQPELPHQLDSFDGPVRVDVARPSGSMTLRGHLEFARSPFRVRFDDASGVVYLWDDRGLRALGPGEERPVVDPLEIARLTTLRQAFDAEPVPGTVRVREDGRMVIEDGDFVLEVRFGPEAGH